MSNKRERGFTLLEVLVAVFIIAVVTATFYSSSHQYLRTGGAVEMRYLALHIAENTLEEARLRGEWLEPGRYAQEISRDGRVWEVVTTVQETGTPNLHRADVAIALGEGEEPILSLTGFLGRY